MSHCRLKKGGVHIDCDSMKQIQTFHQWRPHPWHGISVGKNPPGLVNAYIEIPRGDRRKWELDISANARAIAPGGEQRPRTAPGSDCGPHHIDEGSEQQQHSDDHQDGGDHPQDGCAHGGSLDGRTPEPPRRDRGAQNPETMMIPPLFFKSG